MTSKGWHTAKERVFDDDDWLEDEKPPPQDKLAWLPPPDSKRPRGRPAKQRASSPPIDLYAVKDPFLRERAKVKEEQRSKTPERFWDLDMDEAKPAQKRESK